jgi:hypothetical protein
MNSVVWQIENQTGECICVEATTDEEMKRALNNLGFEEDSIGGWYAFHSSFYYLASPYKPPVSTSVHALPPIEKWCGFLIKEGE